MERNTVSLTIAAVTLSHPSTGTKIHDLQFFFSNKVLYDDENPSLCPRGSAMWISIRSGFVTIYIQVVSPMWSLVWASFNSDWGLGCPVIIFSVSRLLLVMNGLPYGQSMWSLWCWQWDTCSDDHFDLLGLSLPVAWADEFFSSSLLRVHRLVFPELAVLKAFKCIFYIFS